MHVYVCMRALCARACVCMCVCMCVIYVVFNRYADRAKQIVCKAIVNEDPNAKVFYIIIGYV